MTRHLLRFHRLGNRITAAPECGRVGVQHHVIGAQRWRAETIRLARHRREIKHHHGVRRPIVPRVRQHRLLLVGDIDPAKARRLVITPPEARVLTIQRADRLHERHQSLPFGIAQQMPLETDVVIPLVM